MTFEELFSQMEGHFLGLWKFREYGQPVRFNVTFTVMHDGLLHHYDTRDHESWEGAMKEAIETIRRVKA